jgi:predicted porin
VSLSGGFGEVRLGRDYTPTFWNDTVFDPFGTNGVGTNLINTANGYNTTSFGALDPTATGGFGGNTNYVRASNTIGYFLPPNLGGFYGQVMYAFSEQTKFKPTRPRDNGYYGNTARARSLRRWSLRLRQRSAGRRSRTAAAPRVISFTLASTNKVNTFNLGASYDFGPVKLFGEYSRGQEQG